MVVRRSWLFALLLGGAFLFSLPACDDSSDVGLGVGPDSLRGGAPTTLDAVPALDTTREAPTTGRQIVGTQNWRFLVGRVEDPIAGTISTNGYFDVLGRTFLPTPILNAESADSLAAELRFTPTYLHGDSTSTVGVRVLNLAEEAEMGGARADTTFSTGSQVVSASISPTDSLVTIELPQSWISDHLDVLQDTTDGGSAFQDAFHGFKLASTGGNAVVGFSSTTASLRLIHLGDSTTADYSGFKSFTHVDRKNVPPLPEDRLLLQDGVGVGLTMDWDFDENPLDSLKNTPLNRAEIFMPVDTTTLQANAGGSSFVRPLAKGFRIIATRATDPTTPSCSALGAVPFSEANTACVLPLVPGAAPGAAFVSTNVAFPIFERSLLQAPVFTTIRVEIADRRSTSISRNATIQPGLPSTLPVLISTSETDEPSRPRATLTVTPL